MLSALKKWAKGGNDDSKLTTPMGVRAMCQALQRKFARGIQYNSKLFQQLHAIFTVIWIVQFIGPAIDELRILIKFGNNSHEITTSRSFTVQLYYSDCIRS